MVRGCTQTIVKSHITLQKLKIPPRYLGSKLKVITSSLQQTLWCHQFLTNESAHNCLFTPAFTEWMHYVKLLTTAGKKQRQNSRTGSTSSTGRTGRAGRTSRMQEFCFQCFAVAQVTTTLKLLVNMTKEL